MLTLLLSIAHATPWHLPDYGERTRLDFANPTSATQEGLPLLVRLTPSNFDYSDASSTGTGIQFVDADGGPLSHEVDTWDPAGESFVWVGLSSVPSSGHLWMYADPSGTPVDHSDVTKVFPDSFLAVYHLDDIEETRGFESTNTVGSGSTIKGPLGGARSFDGSHLLEIDDSEDRYNLDTLTLSAWVTHDAWPDDSRAWQPIVNKGISSWELARRALDREWTFAIRDLSDVQHVPPVHGVQTPPDTWALVAATYTPDGRHRVFINGAMVSDQAAAGLIRHGTADVKIGGNLQRTPYLHGALDEVRIQRLARSEAWMRLDYLNQTDGLIVSRCDSSPGNIANVHDADGDSVGCDLDCNDDDATVSEEVFAYPDADQDGYGSGDPVLFCAVPSTHAVQDGDCEPDNAAISPDAVEVCNELDDDCDGQVDIEDDDLDPSTVQTYFDDLDGDGAGAGPLRQACSLPTNASQTNDDCNDSNPDQFPSNLDICDGADQNCNGQFDEDAVFTTYWTDNDEDGFGAGPPRNICGAPAANEVAVDGDCDDTNSSVNPNASEICNGGLDDDCDLFADDDDFDVLESSMTAWYTDFDGDGFGTGDLQRSCIVPLGSTPEAGDCDDSSAAFNPAASDGCDGLDQNCNQVPDDDADFTTYYEDLDGDGQGTVLLGEFCAPLLPNQSEVGGDCDDTLSDTYVGAPELCDGLDNDCDEVVDNDVVSVAWWLDLDGDGFGDPATAQGEFCSSPDASAVTNDSDCDDQDAAVNPLATEVSDNGIDEDCDGEDLATLDTGDTGDSGPADTDLPPGPPTDTDVPVATSPPAPPPNARTRTRYGLACQSGGAAPVTLWILALAVARRGRR